MSKPKFEDYDVEIRRLSADEGGGYVITFPDLPGCMSDGETPDEALANGRDAFDAWMDTCRNQGRHIPGPGSRAMDPARFVLRLPRYLHDVLTSAALAQGSSINTLVTSFVAEGLARLEAKPQRSVDEAYIDTRVFVDVAGKGVAYGIKSVPAQTQGQPESITSSVAESKTNVFHISPVDRPRSIQ